MLYQRRNPGNRVNGPNDPPLFSHYAQCHKNGTITKSKWVKKLSSCVKLQNSNSKTLNGIKPEMHSTTSSTDAVTHRFCLIEQPLRKKRYMIYFHSDTIRSVMDWRLRDIWNRTIQFCLWYSLIVFRFGVCKDWHNGNLFRSPASVSFKRADAVCCLLCR